MLEKFLSLYVLLLLIITGCSSTSPVSDSDFKPLENSISVSDWPVIQTGMNSYNGLIGAYNVVIDKETLTGEIVPTRSVHAIGDVFDTHITEFLVQTTVQNCVKISGIGLTEDGYISVNFSLRHPFDNLQKRPDLHIFDVRGIVLTPAGHPAFAQIISDVDGNGVASEQIQTSPRFLINAEGYTTHFDDQTLGDFFDPPLNYPGNLNPFMRFFEDPNASTFDPYHPSGHNVMPVNSDYDTREFVFYTTDSNPTLTFTLIFDAVYGQSANRFNRQNPLYYLPEFNRKEAWSVTTQLIYDTLELGAEGSSAYIRVKVKDWQAMMNKDPDYPNPYNLRGISAKSDVRQVEVSCPEFGFFDVKAKLQAEPGGNGSDATPYIFEFGPIEVTQEYPIGQQPGMYYGLVAVRDDIEGTNGPFPISHPEGQTFPSNGPDITDYTSYQVIKINVRSPGTLGCPPEPIERDDCQINVVFGDYNAEDFIALGDNLSPFLDMDYGVSGLAKDVFAIEKNGYLIGFYVNHPSWGTGYFNLNPGASFTQRVSSIDIDSTNRVIFSKNNIGPGQEAVKVADRNAEATDKFSVWEVNSVPAVPIIEDVDINPTSINPKIIAIETDLLNDVWIIDSAKNMRKFERNANYAEDTSVDFNLVASCPAFAGEVFDFVINYHTKAFFILTDSHPNGTLYRFECDGTFFSSYGGMIQNPLNGVLTGPHNGTADIVIDNYNDLSQPVNGPQDCKILVAGGNNRGNPSDYHMYLARLNSDLGDILVSTRDYGVQCMAFDPVGNVLRAVSGSEDGRNLFTVHAKPGANWD